MSETFSQKLEPKVLGERIRELRRRKGLKQSAFVGRLISSGYISLIEQGKRFPSHKALAHIANVLEVSVSELTRPQAPVLVPEQAALLSQGEMFVEMGDYKAAKHLVSKLSLDAMSSLSGRMLAIELDYGLGNFVAAEIPVRELIEDSIAAFDWQIARKAIITYGRISDLTDTTVELTIFLSNIKRNLNRIEDVDPLLLAQLTAVIADGLVFLGDLVSARRMLTELDLILPRVQDKRGVGSALWVSASVAHESGEFERAITLVEEARNYFIQELDSIAALKLQVKRATILAELGLAGDPRVPEAVAELSGLLVEFEAQDNVKGLLTAKTALAFLWIQLKEYEKAERMLLTLIHEDATNPLFLAYNLVQLGVIHLRRGDSATAKEYLDKAWILKRNFEPTFPLRRELVRLADLYAELGDKDMVIEVLRATNKPVGNFSAIFQDSN